MSDIDTLNQQFAVPQFVKIDAGQGGLPRVVVTNAGAEAHIYLHGAHVTHFKPRGGSNGLFLSAKSLFAADKAIRGGVPIIFPWFGNKAGSRTAPAHGFARSMDWRLVEAKHRNDGWVTVSMELISTPETLKHWPFEFSLRFTVNVGDTLDMELDVLNAGDVPFTYEEALHTYLTVGDVRRAKIEGLGARDFLDKTDGGTRKTQSPGPITLTGETDRVYLNTPEEVSVSDPVLNRRLSVQKDGSATTVLWNPWIAKAKGMSDFGDDEWPNMVCVETANAAENAVTLEPTEGHRMRARIAVG